MYIHKEGYVIILVTFFVSCALLGVSSLLLRNVDARWPSYLAWFAVIAINLFVWYFFRMPNRDLVYNENALVCPADGKVVIVEEVEEPEYFKGKRMQVSVFMSPLNVHVNRYPIDGTVKFYKYHPGKYLVAWHPKSSTLNERTTVVLEHSNGKEVLVRQIAGAVARRIVCYAKEGETVQQNQELGFIKFGSRVDLFLPLDAKILVSPEQVVKGGQTLIAEW